MYKLGEASGPWRYAGRHGWVTEEEFHELGQSNQLKIGAGPWNNAIQGLQRDALALYKQLPDEWEENIETTAGQVAENVGNAYNSLPEGVKEQVQKVKTGFIDIPAQAIQNLSDVDGHIAAGHRYGGLHPGPLELGLEAAHTALTSGGSQVRQLRHLQDLASSTQVLPVNPQIFSKIAPKPNKQQAKQVAELAKEAVTKPATKALSRTNGNGKLKNGTKGDVLTNGKENGSENLNPSTKVTEEEQLFDILNKSVDTYNVKLDQISAQLENLKPTPQNKPIISELNAQKREYNRLASTLQTLFPDLASKSDLKLGDDLSNALSKGGDLFFDDAGKALTNHFDRNSAPQRVTGWNLDVHHMAWLRALVAGIERGKVPTGIRNEAVKRLAIDYEKLVSNNPMNLVGIHGTPTHVAAHGGNVNANYSTKGRDILRRLQTLGPNPTAEQLAAEMNKVVDTMWGMAEEAVLSKPHQKLAFEKFEASNLSPSKKQYYIDEGLNPADTRHPLIPELDKDIKSTESQVSEYSKWLESLTIK